MGLVLQPAAYNSIFQPIKYLGGQWIVDPLVDANQRRPPPKKHSTVIEVEAERFPEWMHPATCNLLLEHVFAVCEAIYSTDMMQEQVNALESRRAVHLAWTRRGPQQQFSRWMTCAHL